MPRSHDDNRTSPPPPSASPDSPEAFPQRYNATLPDSIGCTDRAELIERIKAGEAPTWVSNERTLSTSTRYYPNHTPSSQPCSSPTRPQSALHEGIFTSSSQVVPPSPPHPSSSLREPLTAPPFLGTIFTDQGFRKRNPSLSSSFVLKSPTSPLVHSSNPDGGDFSFTSPASPIAISANDPRSRRISLPPSALQYSPPLSSLPRLQTYSGPRRADGAPEWGPPSPSPSARQARRSSGIGLTSPSSFVGSYEESILNGRMSTTPSKPLNFLATIGVLGLGNCKQSLRCPAHVSIPFPAYFYSVGDYDSPSPYVGQVDLDATGKKGPAGIGGSYRIPARGQLQIVIKNANKTAVKLFLVPYDLRDMDAGTKTFIRQKSYSIAGAGDLPMTAEKRKQERDCLRYLIHLHIVCPSRGRYYLFKSVRIVFANRVPEAKEKLRNEVLWPEPKYSPWRPGTMTPSSIGRQRSASLHSASVSVRRSETTPPVPPLPPQKMEVDAQDDDFGQKVKVGGLSYPQGLLAKRLKQLEVESSAPPTSEPRSE